MSSSSGSSSDSSSDTPPTKKRKQVDVEESSDSPDSGDHDSGTNNSSEEEGDVPQPLPQSESIVLSHAERRRRKKKQRLEAQRIVSASPESPARKKRKLDDNDGTADASPAKNENETATTTNSKSKAKAKTKTVLSAVDLDPKRQKRQNSVWVGNLAFRTTQDALRGFFDGVGTITRVHMPMRRGTETQNENMGFAYVDFETPEAKVIAITLSEGHLDGRNLLIKDGNDFTGRPPKAKTDAPEVGGSELINNGAAATDGKAPHLSKTAQKILRTQKQPPGPTLFLGNLGFDTTEVSIRELFEAHRYWRRKNQEKGVETEGLLGGNEGQDGTSKSKDVWIRKIRMGTFEDSGACKGFAFVDFTSIEHATVALVNPRNHRLNGRDLVVEYASPEAVRRGGGGPRNPKGDRNKDGRHAKTTPQRGPANSPYTKQRRPRHIDGGAGADGDVGAEATTTTHSQRPDRSHGRRAKPGAALAQAQRQSAAILPSQGQKIVF